MIEVSWEAFLAQACGRCGVLFAKHEVRPLPPDPRLPDIPHGELICPSDPRGGEAHAVPHTAADPSQRTRPRQRPAGQRRAAVRGRLPLRPDAAPSDAAPAGRRVRPQQPSPGARRLGPHHERARGRGGREAALPHAKQPPYRERHPDLNLSTSLAGTVLRGAAPAAAGLGQPPAPARRTFAARKDPR